MRTIAVVVAVSAMAGCATQGTPPGGVAGGYSLPMCMPCPNPCFPTPDCAGPSPKMAAAPAPAPAPAPAAAPAPQPAPAVVTASVEPAPPPPPPAPAPAAPARVVVTKQKVELKEKVFFDSGKTTIQPVSFPLLGEVADVLKANPDVKRVVVEGHTDDRGEPGFNQTLSEGRAKSVREYLVGKGIAAERLEARGYGETKPVADNKTAKGREANRRVELTIAE